MRPIRSLNNHNLCYPTLCAHIYQAIRLETIPSHKKIKKYFELDDLRNLILAIKQQAIFVNVTSKETICRDAKDNFLLSLAKDSKATHLITGDKDLLILENYNATKIINITTYFQLNKI